MIDKLLQEIEDLIGSDDFEYDAEEKMQQLIDEGAGFEIVTALLAMMERHPLADFGCPGCLVHFIEEFDPAYESCLVESLKRRPAMHTVWMLNRCINGNSRKEEYMCLLKEIANREDIEPEIRTSAQEFLDFQIAK